MEHPHQDSQLSAPAMRVLFYSAVILAPFYEWRQFNAGGFTIKLDWIVMFLLSVLLSAVFMVRRGFTDRIRSNLTHFFLIFFLINLMASLLSPYPAMARDGLFQLIIAFLFILMAEIVLSKKDYTTYFPAVICLSVTFSSLLSSLGFFFQVDFLTVGLIADNRGDVLSRGVGGSGGANNSALMYLFVLPILVHWFFYSKSRSSKLFAVMQICVILLGVISTMSRGGFLMLIFVSALIAWTNRHHFSPKFIGIVLAIICAVMITGLLVIPDSFYQRQATLTEGVNADMAMSRRAAYLKVGLKSFSQAPVLGKGTSVFRSVWRDSNISHYFKNTFRYAHNTYMEVLVGSGLVGLTAFLALLLRIFLNYCSACTTFFNEGDRYMYSLASAYRVSFISVCVYLIILSAIEHKVFLMAIALSQVSQGVAEKRECYTL